MLLLVSVSVKLDDFVKFRQLPKAVKYALIRSPRVRAGFKTAGLHYFSIQQQRFLRNSEGGREWQPISLLARLIRKRGRRGKSQTIPEFLRRTENMKILRDTSTLFNSIGPRRSNSKRILTVGRLSVLVGTRDKKADKHHYGRTSNWPGFRDLKKALDSNFVQRNRKSSRLISPAKPRGGSRKIGSKVKITRAGDKQIKQIKKGIRKVKKAVQTTKQTVKTAKAALTDNSLFSSEKITDLNRISTKNLNPDYVKMLYIIKRKAGKRFTLPRRPVLHLPTKPEIAQIERIIQKPVREEMAAVSKRLKL